MLPYSGLNKIIDKISEKDKKYLESLDGFSYECQTIPASEFWNLQEILAFIMSVKDLSEMQQKDIEIVYGKNGWMNPRAFAEEQHKIENEAVKKVFELLERFNIWSYKFSTMSDGRVDEELIRGPNDSIYFVSPSGVSLRFKIANKGRGFLEIVQPFMEKIFFDKIGENLSEIPKMGYFVQECTTREFWDLLKGKKINRDYVSSIRKYRCGEKLEIPKLDNIICCLDGNSVNYIYKKLPKRLYI